MVQMMGNNLGYGYGSMMGGGVWLWLLICAGIVFLFLIVAGLLFMFIAMVKRPPMGHSPSNETPVDVLNRRYANGEIDKKEYDQRKKDLQ
jgi:putative membrane protein